MAFAVRDRRVVEVHPSQGESFKGYFMGADDYHWIILDSDTVEVVLVPKGTAILRITRQTLEITGQSQPGRRKDIIERIEPFRQWVLRHFFGETPGVSSSSGATT